MLTVLTQRISLSSPSGFDELAVELKRNSCAIVVDHGIPDEVFEDVQTAAADFFGRPLDEKMLVDITASKSHRGYVAVTEAGAYGDEGGIRRYEAFDVGLHLEEDHPAVRDGTPLMGANRWPSDGDLERAATKCFAAMDALTADMLAAVVASLGAPPGSLVKSRQAPLSQMRLLNYFARPANAGSHAAMGAHTDYEFLTIIREWGCGLEIRDDAGQWHTCDASDGALTVLAGDLLDVATGGQIRSAMHRVCDMPGTRFAIPFFAGADFHAEVTRLDIEPTIDLDAAPPESILAGPHLLAQLRRDFPYLRPLHPADESTVIDLEAPALVDVTGGGLDLTDDARWMSDFEKRRLAGG